MHKLTEKLFIASCRECPAVSTNGFRFIYSCHWPCASSQRLSMKGPCQQIREREAGEKAVGHFWDVPNLEIPNYQPHDFVSYLDHIDRTMKDGEVVLVSENGESRAPSLALLWMAFRGNLISRSSFAAARADFTLLYPKYVPWPGWVIFFEQEWDAFK